MQHGSLCLTLAPQPSILKERGTRESNDPVCIAVSFCRPSAGVITSPLGAVTTEVEGHLAVSSHRQDSDLFVNFELLENTSLSLPTQS